MLFCFFKQKTAYEMRISDWSSDVCSSDLVWEEHIKILKDQLFIFAKQNRRLERLRNKVDYIVTDSPGILALAYQIPNYYPTFEPLEIGRASCRERVCQYV